MSPAKAVAGANAQTAQKALRERNKEGRRRGRKNSAESADHGGAGDVSPPLRGRLFERRHQPFAEAKPGSSRGKGIPRHGKRRLWMEEGVHVVCVLSTGFWSRRRSCSHMVGTKASSKPATHKRHTFPHVGDKTWGKNYPPTTHAAVEKAAFLEAVRASYRAVFPVGGPCAGGPSTPWWRGSSAGGGRGGGHGGADQRDRALGQRSMVAAVHREHYMALHAIT